MTLPTSINNNNNNNHTHLADRFIRISMILLLVQNTFACSHPFVFMGTLVYAIALRQVFLRETKAQPTNQVVPSYGEMALQYFEISEQNTMIAYVIPLCNGIVPLIRSWIATRDTYFVASSMCAATLVVTINKIPSAVVINTLFMFGGVVIWLYRHMHVLRVDVEFVAMHMLWPLLIMTAAIAEIAIYYAHSLHVQAETNQRLEQSSKAKSMFLSTIGHEVRTPLNAIIGCTELLLKEEQSSNNNDRTSLHNIVLASASSLLDSMNAVLSYVGMEHNKAQQKPLPAMQDFDLKQLVLDAVHIASWPAKTKNLFITTNFTTFEHYKHIFVHGYSQYVRDILINLLSNACKFTDQGGITITVSSAKDGDHFSFQVADTGIGICPEFQSRMFQPFSQQDMSHTRKYEGSGLGLAIVHSYIEQMHGTIQCESQVGQGTTFFVTIPLRAVTPAVTTQVKHSKSNSTTSNPSVLVVDDNTINVKILCKQLSSLQIVHDFAYSGEQAIAKQKSSSFDMLFIDLHMPGMSGLETIATIRTFDTRCKVFLVTGAELGSLKESNLQHLAIAGMYQKPVTMAMILQMLCVD